MLKHTKIFLSIIAVLALVLGLCSCSGKPETNPDTTADSAVTDTKSDTGADAAAKDTVPESGAAVSETDTVKEENTAAPTEKETRVTNANVSSAGFIWPVPGYTQLSSPYSAERKRITIRADFGANVVACADGKITKTYKNDYDAPCVELTCDNGYVIVYGAAKFSVKEGDSVKQGDSMGFVGKYGTGSYLYIAATKNGASVDPETIIKP